MGATCACGKAITQGGNRIVRHGLSKKSGGIGLHTTGISPRTFKRNAQMMKVRRPDGTVRRMKVCTKCIKAGTYEKAP
jgi:large subunit ribosomal protein L28